MITKYGHKNMSVKNVSAKCGNHLMDPFNFPLNEKVVQGWLWLQHNFEEMCGNRHPLYYSLPLIYLALPLTNWHCHLLTGIATY